MTEFVGLKVSMKKTVLQPGNGHRRLSDDAARLEGVLETAVDAIITSDESGRIEIFNSAAEKIFGYSRDEIIGRSVGMLMTENDRHNHQAYISRYLSTHTPHLVGEGREVIAQRRNGDTFYAEIALSETTLGGRTTFTAIIRDISDQKQSQERITQLAYFDHETSLPNRAYLQERLESLLHSGAPRCFLLSIDMGDLTKLYSIFGAHGINLIVGDYGRRLLGQLTPGSIVARTGSHRFKALFIPMPNEKRSAAELADHLYRDMKQPLATGDSNVYLNCRFGMLEVSPSEVSAEQLIERSDIALLETKSNPGCGFLLFSSEYEEKIHRHSRIVQLLHSAMAQMPFQLYMQPQYHIGTGDVVGAEALIRWANPENDWVLPDEFIPIAETTGLIQQITQWTLFNACSIARSWGDEKGDGHLRIGVNISAHALVSPTFSQLVQSILRETLLDPWQLELEITETALVTNVEVANNNLRKLQALGVTVAIDDFGTGQSSLSYLKLFAIDRLKIDRSFVQSAADGKRDNALLETIVHLGHAMRIPVIAEGVESETILTALKEMGCDEAQGNLLSRPMPAEAFAELVKVG
ncbi:MAG: EAL domain-containing protein [Candidatus Sedimenticola sp. (ex Thyasira tokunagai)]